MIARELGPTRKLAAGAGQCVMCADSAAAPPRGPAARSSIRVAISDAPRGRTVLMARNLIEAAAESPRTRRGACPTRPRLGVLQACVQAT